ncbi:MULTISPECIES: hypothetical protein [Pseudomonas]|uniref:DUF7683 domain-containing protein n=1 Tax=Pseudomonas sp. Hg7Tf TaxID=3236988 RepID=A0AB39HY06_9PSED|nr:MULTISPECIES: hypothetical protein [Pseudomonas]MDD1977878.1 hypothetical protein [Pseudomonas putida]MDH2561129.1 hypothetical protein [Pseudomonas sp. Hg5Tf]
MKHVIEVFDSKTEELLKTVEIPSTRLAELVELMGWEDPEDEIYVYDLSPEQLSTIAEWTHTQFSETNNIIQLVCIA